MTLTPILLQVRGPGAAGDLGSTMTLAHVAPRGFSFRPSKLYLADLQRNGMAYTLDQIGQNFSDMGDVIFPMVHPILTLNPPPPPPDPWVPIVPWTGGDGPQPIAGSGGGADPNAPPPPLPPPPPLTPEQRRQRACAIENQAQFANMIAATSLALWCSTLVVDIPICGTIFATFLLSLAIH